MREVLSSKSFERTTSLRRLLEYLWVHRGDELNEYAIATEALSRPSDFDSKIDATVRVQIGRLRRNLDRFYSDEGSHHIWRLTIPIGSHELRFVPATDAEVSTASTLMMAPGVHLMPDAMASTVAELPRPWISEPLGYVLLTCVLVCTVLLAANLMRHSANSSEQTDTPQFWKTFLDNGKNTRFVLPAPIFFSVQTNPGHTLMLRDIFVNSPSQWNSSPALTAMFGRTENPRVWQGYTVASDTFASLQLARFLDRYGVRTSFSSSADPPREILDHENIIAFGTSSSLASFQSDVDRLNFRLAPHEVKVTDLLSPSDHPQEFLATHEATDRDIVPGIVAVIPHGNTGGRLMLVQGAQTRAIISYLTSDEGMKEMAAALSGMKTPYFEAVVLSEVNRGAPLQSRLGTVRPFVERSVETTAKLLQTQQNNK